MSSIETYDSLYSNRITANDWELIIINNPIQKYLDINNLLELSKTSKRVRLKLCQYLFNILNINIRSLLLQPNYFQHKLNYVNVYLSCFEVDSLLNKKSYDKDVSFKATHIDPFINQTVDSFDNIRQYCRTICFNQLKRDCYFLTPIMYQFTNLRKLHIFNCDLPLYDFNSVFENLLKLSALHLELISLFIRAEDSNLSNNLIFPKNLNSLSYRNIKLVITNHPASNTIYFASNQIPIYEGTVLDISLQNLPMLEILRYTNAHPSTGLPKFLELNIQLESLIITITQLTPSTLSKLAKMPNLKRLKIESNNANFDVPHIDPRSPKIKKLKELVVFMSSDSDFLLIRQIITYMPNLTQLSVRSVNDSRFITFDEAVNNLNYFTTSTILCNRFSFITKIYTK